jgi:hypothetical protein
MAKGFSRAGLVSAMRRYKVDQVCRNPGYSAREDASRSFAVSTSVEVTKCGGRKPLAATAMSSYRISALGYLGADCSK